MSGYTVGPAPFDQLTADITLRTPDRVDFQVHSHILAQASPVFAGMFSLPQPPPEADTIGSTQDRHRPIVDVTEDSKTLERLLRLCYPINKQHLGELEDIVPVLRAATKYEMEWPVSLLMNDLLAVAPKRPLKVWAVACQTGLEEVARRAACAMRERATTATQCLPVLETLLKEEGLPVLDGIFAGDYYRLREFLRLEVTDASFKLLNRPTWSLPSNFLFGFLSTFQPSSTPSSTPAASVPSYKGGKLPGWPTPVRKFSVPSEPAPDLVLKCRDGEQILAHQLIIVLHSAPLKAQLEAAKKEGRADISSPGGSSAAIPPTPARAIDVDLDSRTLIALLSVLYEGEERLRPYSLPQRAVTLLAAQKYEISLVVRALQANLEKEVTQKPLEAYFVAVQHGLDEYARGAARNVLQDRIAGRYTPPMEESPALAYHRLLVYYDSCARVVTEQLDNAVVNWNTATSKIASSVYAGSTYINTPSQTWMATYLQSLKTPEALAGGPGRTVIVTTQELLRKACSYPSVWPKDAERQCQSIGNGLIQIGTTLPQAIMDAIAQVELEL